MWKREQASSVGLAAVSCGIWAEGRRTFSLMVLCRDRVWPGETPRAPSPAHVGLHHGPRSWLGFLPQSQPLTWPLALQTTPLTSPLKAERPVGRGHSPRSLLCPSLPFQVLVPPGAAGRDWATFPGWE